MNFALPAVPVLLLTAVPAFGHRLDEYLQGTLISVGRNRLEAQMTLTPGVAVFPTLIAAMDANRDGVISEDEQRAYTGQVLRDLTLTIDGRPLRPRIISAQFSPVSALKEGVGKIVIEFDAELPPGGPNRKLTFANRHQSAISAYQVNALVPHEPGIQILFQKRNDSQSLYELDFVDNHLGTGWLPANQKLVRTAALLLLVGLAFLWRRRV